MTRGWRPGLGAVHVGGQGCQFRVWAPWVEEVSVHVVEPQERLVPMKRGQRGYHSAAVEGISPGALYLYRLDGGRERPDPASRSQPRGVHGPSQVTGRDFAWGDGPWQGLPLEDYVLYELHVGTYTGEGTFDAIIPHLDGLAGLGITAIELMPVAQFPGSRNWGYDGVFPFAAQGSYGGPEGLKRLADACHRKGLALVLDVVYNHLGPEGNYLGDFGPYFTDRYRTPWGSALNFDGPGSDEVRHFFIENALYWIVDCHVDALRLDALHAILDLSARPFLQELATAVHEQGRLLGRSVYLFAESDRNDARLVRPQGQGGYGLDAHWNDDFHHALHALLTGERQGYYRDFGRPRHMAKAVREGFVYSGQRSAYRQHRHGSSSRDIPAHRLVAFAQNHDQVGNRMLGERLGQLTSLQGQELAAAVLLLSPCVPLIFMGQEYGETAPFLYFTSHSDPQLAAAVRQGRREEFDAFSWEGEPPDPQAEATFLRSKLDHLLRGEGHHRVLLDLYRELLRLREAHPALARPSKEHAEVTLWPGEGVLSLRRWGDGREVAIAFNVSDRHTSLSLPMAAGRWRRVLDSAEERWLGEGSTLPAELCSEGEVKLALGPWAFVMFDRTGEA